MGFSTLPDAGFSASSLCARAGCAAANRRQAARRNRRSRGGRRAKSLFMTGGILERQDAVANGRRGRGRQNGEAPTRGARPVPGRSGNGGSGGGWRCRRCGAAAGGDCPRAESLAAREDFAGLSNSGAAEFLFGVPLLADPARDTPPSAEDARPPPHQAPRSRAENSVSAVPAGFSQAHSCRRADAGSRNWNGGTPRPRSSDAVPPPGGDTDRAGRGSATGCPRTVSDGSHDVPHGGSTRFAGAAALSAPSKQGRPAIVGRRLGTGTRSRGRPE